MHEQFLSVDSNQGEWLAVGSPLKGELFGRTGDFPKTGCCAIHNDISDIFFYDIWNTFYHIFLKAAVYDWDVQYFQSDIYDSPLLLLLVFCRFYCRRMKDIEKAFAYISWKKKNICIHYPQFWISNLNVSFHELWPNILEEVEEKKQRSVLFPCLLHQCHLYPCLLYISLFN